MTIEIKSGFKISLQTSESDDVKLSGLDFCIDPMYRLNEALIPDGVLIWFVTKHHPGYASPFLRVYITKLV